MSNVEGRVVSFLGTGDYKPVRYRFGDRLTDATPYFSVALGRERFAQTYEHIVLATEAARRVHGDSLTNALSATGVRCEIRTLSGGTDADAVWSQFDQIYDAIFHDAPERVVLDITHGFRADPFFAGTVIAFGLSLHRMPGRSADTQLEVWYGRYEASSGATERVGTAVDLSATVELLELTLMVHLFLHSGHLPAGFRRFRERYGEDVRARLGNQTRTLVNHVLSRIEEFAHALSTLRVGDLILGPWKKGKRRESLAAALVRAIDEKGDADAWLPPLRRLFAPVREMANALVGASTFSDADGWRSLRALARLLEERMRDLEAMAVVREGLVCELAAGQPAATDPGDQFDEKIRNSVEDMLREAIRRAHGPHVQQVRNDLLHAGFRKKPERANNLQQQVEDIVNWYSDPARPPLRR